MNKRLVLGNGASVTVLGVIKGLFSERENVRNAFENDHDLVAVSISPEELEGLRAYREGKVEDDYELSDYELIYAQNLRKFGKVGLPPPCFVEALKEAASGDIPVSAIDMDETKYTNAYCAYISGTALVRHSLRKGIMKHMEIKASTPEEFVMKWDAKINKISGFKKLEEKRESHMAKRLLRLSDEHRNMLAIIELERAGGVIEKVKTAEGDKKASRQ